MPAVSDSVTETPAPAARLSEMAGNPPPNG